MSEKSRSFLDKSADTLREGFDLALEAKRRTKEIWQRDQEITQFDGEIAQEQLPKGQENFSYRSDLHWKKLSPLETGVFLKLDFSLDDVVPQGKVDSYLLANGLLLREKIFRFAAERALPKIIAEANGGVIPSYSQVQTQHRIRTASTCQHHTSSQKVFARNRLALNCRLNSSRNIPPLAAIHSARLGIAENIAHTMMQDLESNYLGKKSSVVQSEAQISDNSLRFYQPSFA